MKRIFTSLILLLSITQCFSTENGKLSYVIKVEDINSKKLEISLTFKANNDRLIMANGANQFEERWARFISNIRANSNGQSIEVDKRGNAEWALDIKSGETVTVQYTVNIDHENENWSSGIDGAAYARENTIFSSGRAAFIIPENQSGDIAIQFELPEGSSVTTPWSITEGNETSFSVRNTEELTQSGFLLGKHESVTINRDGFELIFALGSEHLIKNANDYKELGAGVFDYYIDMMGGIPQMQGIEDQKCLIILGEHNQTDGEVLGNTISIVLNTGGGQMDFLLSRFIFAHEFFHLWNGKTFVPQGLDLEWFREGVTNYYTLKSLYSIGVLNDEAIFGVLNNLFYQRYINDPELNSIPLSDGSAKHNHWGIIYGGGLFAGIVQDIIIRESSNNKLSLDNVMRQLYTESNQNQGAFTTAQLQLKLEEASGKNQKDFFGKYINRANRIPIEDFLNKSGLNAKIEGNQLSISHDENASAKEKEMLLNVLGQLKL